MKLKMTWGKSHLDGLLVQVGLLSDVLHGTKVGLNFVLDVLVHA